MAKQNEKIQTAIKQHTGQFKNEFELMAALKEGGDFTEAELMQIAQGCEYKEVQTPAPASANLKSGKQVYELWEIHRNIPQFDEATGQSTVSFDKLKRIKERVLITDEQAEVLNTGRFEDSANRVFEVYLKPDAELPKLILPGTAPLKPVVKKATLQY